MFVTLFSVFAACSSNSAGSPSVAAAGPPPAAAHAPASTTANDGVVATWQGGSLTYGEVEKDIDLDLIKMQADYMTNRYEAESQALDSKVNDALLAAEAKKRGLADKDALLKVEVEDKTAAPTDS